MLSLAVVYPQVHHARIAQARGASPTTDGGDERSIVAIRGHPVPKERSLPRRGGICQLACEKLSNMLPRFCPQKFPELMTALMVHTQVNTNGNVVRSEILGAIKMKCYLSGMPELRLGLNDKVMFENTGRSEWCTRVQAWTMCRRTPTKPNLCSPPQNSISRESDRDGRRQIPPMCPVIPVRERPHHLVHPTGWGIRAHELSAQHSSETAHLGRGTH